MAGGVTSIQVLPGSLNAIGDANASSPQFCTFMTIYYSWPSIYDEVAQDGRTFADIHDNRTPSGYQRVTF
jgi:hypothetical protein